jgi:hypothetical protein
VVMKWAKTQHFACWTSFVPYPTNAYTLKLSEFILHNNCMRFNLLDECLSYLMANAAPVRVSEIAFSYKLTHSAIIANC